MNNLKNLVRRLAKVENLTTFGKKHKLPYRTLQRIRAGGSPNLATYERLEKALVKEGL